jgi:hypothetical protein
MRSLQRLLAVLLGLTLAVACSHTDSASPVASAESGADAKPACGDSDLQCKQLNIMARTRSRYGIGCWGHVVGGHSPNPSPPPQSYLVSDMGKPGTPQLTPAERSMVDGIQRHLHSATLRVGWLGRHSFIVFDAVDGPCMDAAPGYPVLNYSCHQNDFYQPGENPYGMGAGPTEMQCSPRPWLPSGESTGSP